MHLLPDARRADLFSHWNLRHALEVIGLASLFVGERDQGHDLELLFLAQNLFEVRPKQPLTIHLGKALEFGRQDKATDVAACCRFELHLSIRQKRLNRSYELVFDGHLLTPSATTSAALFQVLSELAFSQSESRGNGRSNLSLRNSARSRSSEMYR